MRSLTLAGIALLVACNGDVREGTVPNEAQFPPSVEQVNVTEPVPFTARSASKTYGLPRSGKKSVADLLALVPTNPSRSDSNMVIAPGQPFPTDQCQGGPATESAELPMELEVVVTLQPRQYIKTPVCGQDERNYGSFVVEDDTGGIVVHRDSRVTPYNVGDRLKLKVRGISFTYGADDRAITIADFEYLPVAEADARILYSETTASFTSADVGRTRRVEGFVAQPPTNSNFNAMVLTDRLLPAVAPETPIDAVCIEYCRTPCTLQCVSDNDVMCAKTICPALCQGKNVTFDGSKLPACWNIAVDVELGRRGFSAPVGQHALVTGPVVKGFSSYVIWMARLGQFEEL